MYACTYADVRFVLEVRRKSSDFMQKLAPAVFGGGEPVIMYTATASVAFVFVNGKCQLVLPRTHTHIHASVNQN